MICVMVQSITCIICGMNEKVTDVAVKPLIIMAFEWFVSLEAKRNVLISSVHFLLCGW